MEESHPQCNQHTVKWCHCCILKKPLPTQFKQVVVGWTLLKCCRLLVGEAGSSLVSAHPGLLCILMPFPQNDPRERFWNYEIGAKNNLSKLLLMESCVLLNYAVSWKMPPPHSKMQIFIVKRQVLENDHTARVRGLLHVGHWVVLWDGSS